MLALLKGVLNMEKDDGRKVSQEDLAAWLLNQMRKVPIEEMNVQGSSQNKCSDMMICRVCQKSGAIWSPSR